ncbi:hypothetical protein, partial [Streptomyces sp. NPDC004599]
AALGFLDGGADQVLVNRPASGADGGGSAHRSSHRTGRPPQRRGTGLATARSAAPARKPHPADGLRRPGSGRPAPAARTRWARRSCGPDPVTRLR